MKDDDIMGRPLQRNLAGERYGSLTVLHRAPNRGDKVMWLCECDCGNLTSVQTFSLIFGDTTSCGCYRRMRTAERNAARKKYMN